MEYCDRFFAEMLQQSLYELRKEELLCDVKLEVDGHYFFAHKSLLAAASPYFRNMFNCKTGFIESRQEVVPIHDIDKNILEIILDFIYTSTIQINEENVYDLMEVSDIFQLNSLRASIQYYLQSTINERNCLSVYINANLRNYHELADLAFRYTLSNFRDVVKHEEFCKIPVDVLGKIVSSKLLNVADEGTLLQHVLSWVKASSERSTHLEYLMNKIELSQVQMQILILIKNDSLFEHSHLQSKIAQVINDTLAKKYESGVEDFMTVWGNGRGEKRLRYDSEQEVIFAIGGESSGTASRSTECFTLGYDRWKCVVPQSIVIGSANQDTRVIPTMRCARYHAAVTYDDYNAYVIGGRNSTEFLNECETYNIKTNQWNNLTPLPKHVVGSGAALCDGTLVVIGGQDKFGAICNCWELDRKRNVWKDLEPLKTSRYFHGVASILGFIFVVGGFIKVDHEFAVNTAQKFDPVQNKWYRIASMHEARAKFGCAAVDNYLYVIGGTDGRVGLSSVERYNVLTNEWSYMASMPVPRSCFAVTVSDRRIYCLGGNDTIHYLNTIDKFNPKTNKWHCVHAMQVSRFGLAAATLFVPVLREVNH